MSARPNCKVLGHIVKLDWTLDWTSDKLKKQIEKKSWKKKKEKETAVKRFCFLTVLTTKSKTEKSFSMKLDIEPTKSGEISFFIAEVIITTVSVYLF